MAPKTRRSNPMASALGPRRPAAHRPVSKRVRRGWPGRRRRWARAIARSAIVQTIRAAGRWEPSQDMLASSAGKAGALGRQPHRAGRAGLVPVRTVCGIKSPRRRAASPASRSSRRSGAAPTAAGRQGASSVPACYRRPGSGPPPPARRDRRAFRIGPALAPDRGDVRHARQQGRGDGPTQFEAVDGRGRAALAGLAMRPDGNPHQDLRSDHG